MPIDVHCHCVPPAVVRTLRSRGRHFGVEILDEPPRARIAQDSITGPLRVDLGDIEARLAAMDESGVRMQLLSCFVDLTAYALAPNQGRAYSRMYNEALADTVRENPDRFGALATVPLQDAGGAADELRHAVVELGMSGVQIATTVNGAELDDPSLEPFWARAEELGCLVLLHPLAALTGRGLRRYFTANSVGNPAETTIALAHLLHGGVLERHPGLQVCAVHGGGFLPYQLGRIRRAHTHGPFPITSGQDPLEALRLIYFDTLVHDPLALEYLVRRVGVDRVVLGSDYPFEMGDPSPVRNVRELPGLDDPERQAILSGNVQRILGAIRR